MKSSRPNVKLKSHMLVHHRANVFLTAPVSSTENQAWQIIIFSFVSSENRLVTPSWPRAPLICCVIKTKSKRKWRDQSASSTHRSLSPWSRRPCDPARRRSPGSRCCCSSWVSWGVVWWAACCCCRHLLHPRPRRRLLLHRWISCSLACRASCSLTGYCFWTGCCSTAAASCLKTTGWPWTACPEWPPVCWEMQVADCKYVNKKYTTTQPLHSSQHAARGEEWKKSIR